MWEGEAVVGGDDCCYYRDVGLGAVVVGTSVVNVSEIEASVAVSFRAKKDLDMSCAWTLRVYKSSIL